MQANNVYELFDLLAASLYYLIKILERLSLSMKKTIKIE